MQCYASRSRRDGSGRGLRRTLSNVSGRRVDAFTATAACVALAEVARVHPRLRVGHATKVLLSKWSVRVTPLLSPTAQFSLGRWLAAERPWPDGGICANNPGSKSSTLHGSRSPIRATPAHRITSS